MTLPRAYGENVSGGSGGGNDWRVGAGAPSLIGGDEEGDMYLDTTADDIYQVQSSVWAFVSNITGATGAQGDPGVDGNDWRTAAGAPSLIGGDEEGDMYLNETNGDVYQVVSSAWALSTNIIGATGAAGAAAPENRKLNYIF